MRNDTNVSVRPICENDLPDLVRLHVEFEHYLSGLSRRRKAPFPEEELEERLRRDAFGLEPTRALRGFIASVRDEAVGYVYYHMGYDPDEMRGRAVYVVDLFVSDKARRRGVGSRLMGQVGRVCRESGAVGVYFAVWKRNPAALRFYRKIGAKQLRKMRLMVWKK